MNSVIIGHGMVGKAVAHVFGIKHYIDIKGSNISYKDAASKRYIFLCLPTNVNNGNYDVNSLIESIKAIHSFGNQNVFIIKSTVYPGFADHIMDTLGINSVISCPEFLSEDTWKKDSQNPDKIVIGGRFKNYIDDVVGLHKARYRGVDIFTTDNVTAELSKWAINGFYAIKVVYANQVYDFAQAVKADYNKINEIMYQDKYIGKNHLEIWHKNGRGAGGKCLKKDLEAFANMSQMKLIKTTDHLNKNYLSKDPK